MKNIKRIFGVIILTLFSSISFALNPPTPDFSMFSFIDPILGVIKWVAIVVAVVMTVYIGIKYLTAGAGTKASVKSDMIPLLIGALIVATASTLTQFAFDTFTI